MACRIVDMAERDEGKEGRAALVRKVEVALMPISVDFVSKLPQSSM